MLLWSLIAGGGLLLVVGAVVAVILIRNPSKSGPSFSVGERSLSSGELGGSALRDLFDSSSLGRKSQSPDAEVVTIGKLKHSLPAPQSAIGRTEVNHLAFSPDGSVLATGDERGHLQLWNVDSGANLKDVLAAQRWGVRSLAYHPDNQLMVVGDHDESQIRNASTGELVKNLEPKKGVDDVEFSPDGRWLAVGCWGDPNPPVYVYDTKSWELKYKYPSLGTESETHHVAFSPDSKWLALGLGHPLFGGGDSTGNIIMHEIGTDKVREIKTSHIIRSVKFHPKRNVLATAGPFSDGIELWDAETGKRLLALAGHRGGVWSLAFSSDGTKLLSGGKDNRARLWDVETGNQLGIVAQAKFQVWCVALSPDAKTAAVSTYDWTGGASSFDVTLWDISGLPK